MRVLIIITSLRGGGAERVATMLANHLDDNDSQVYIYTLDGGSVDYILNEKVKVINFPFYKLSKSLLRLLFIPIQSLYLIYLMKKYSIEKKISFIHRANIVNAFASLFKIEPIIMSERSLFSFEYKGLKKFIMKILLKLAYGKKSKIIAISNAVKKELVTELSVKKESIEVIFNPLDEIFFKKNNSFIKLESLVFVTVGRLVKSKGVDIVLKGFCEILKKYPNARLNIIGEGIEKENLIQLSKTLKIDESVNFIGFRKDLNIILHQSDVFLYASEHESFGNVMIEAAASKLVLVIPDNLMTAKEIFNCDTDLLLYKSKDFNDLASHVDYVIQNDLIENYQNKAYIASKKFDKNIILKKYINIINGEKD